MKKILLPLILTLFFLNGFGTTHTITNVGYTFSPASLTINLGDDVLFSLDATMHNAIEVSLDTWNANGTSPVTGFSLPLGGGTVSIAQLPVGTHYYVCQYHAFLNMKGIITVQSTSAVPVTKVQNDVSIYPNPARDNITVKYEPSTSNAVEIKLFNLQGKLVNVLLPKTEVSGLFLRTFSLNNIVGPGVYFVQISSDKSITFQKVVIL